MKKQTFYFIIGALAAGTACTSTDSTTADTTTATTTETTTSADPAATTETGRGTDLATDVAAAMTNMDDETFVKTAASSNLLEIQLGNLAVQNASDPKVKEFGQMMVEHHTMANQQLQTIASDMGVTLPQTLLPVHETLAEQLEGKTGNEFDEDYMDTMETAHKMDLAMYKAKDGNATNPSVKAYASKTLPILQTHHNTATSTEDKVD